VDALTNYLSALGYSLEEDSLFKKYWPADQHHIGKDILKFHAIIWPAMLLSLGLPLPKQIIIHGWVMLGQEKLSKSKGITLDPDDLSQRYGVEPLRYFLMREISFGLDGSFTHDLFVRRFNSDLSNDIGNLVSRTIVMIEKYCGGVVPGNENYNPKFKEKWEEVKSYCMMSAKEMRFNDYLSKISELVNMANKYIEDSQPWNLAKSNEKKDKEKLNEILYTLSESIRLSSLMLYPVMPVASAKIYKQIGIPIEDKEFDLKYMGTWGSFKGLVRLGEREILFPRIKEE